MPPILLQASDERQDGLPKWGKYEGESELIPKVLEDTKDKIVN